MTVLSKKAVFIARKPEATRHPEEFAPMDHTRSNDELVYSVPVRKKSTFLVLFSCSCR